MLKTFQEWKPSGTPDVFSVEPFLEGGEVVKFSGNNGYINEDAYNMAVHAFSHWTWHSTGGRLMVGVT
jgi:hypothetical protein